MQILKTALHLQITMRSGPGDDSMIPTLQKKFHTFIKKRTVVLNLQEDGLFVNRPNYKSEG